MYFSKILPNVKETVDILRNEHHLKIGLTTGFTRDMVNVLEKNVNAQGVFLDSTVAGMMYKMVIDRHLIWYIKI